jgi:prolipoprotein diacylglyceryltransferase
VLYGALIFGTLGGWYACRHLELPTGEALDAAAVGTPLGIAIGRIGCLMKGCCHGGPCDWWCGIRYPKVFDVYGNVLGSAAYLEQLHAHQISAADTWSLPVHPAPIYESIACLGMAAVMFAL